MLGRRINVGWAGSPCAPGVKSPYTYGRLLTVAVSVASVVHCHVKQVMCFMYGTSPVQHHSCTGAREMRALPTVYSIARRSVGQYDPSVAASCGPPDDSVASFSFFAITCSQFVCVRALRWRGCYPLKGRHVVCIWGLFVQFVTTKCFWFRLIYFCFFYVVLDYFNCPFYWLIVTVPSILNKINKYSCTLYISVFLVAQ